MNQKALTSSAHIGGASILMIFVSLCLTTFATLAMVSASASFRLAERVVESSDNYFAADNRAEEILAEISTIIQSQDRETAARFRDLDLDFAQPYPGNWIISYTVPIDRSRTLHVGVEIYNQLLHITSWRVEASYTSADFEDIGIGVWVP
ncbi:MAG: hypothetical protein FWE24_09435 [Defluviitaleaceae bacterium]|nr:hypothetical protein [Defluviitaleaceae bacterium]